MIKLRKTLFNIYLDTWGDEYEQTGRDRRAKDTVEESNSSVKSRARKADENEEGDSGVR